MNRVARYWPLFGVRVITPRLEMRIPDDDDIAGLVDEIVEGIHDPETMPFNIAWTDVPSPRRERESVQWWWGRRANWSPTNWHFTGAVFVAGRPVGIQDMSAENFAELRTVQTGSWLGRRHQGQGIGTEMRAAILHLAFDGLGALEAHSGAWHDNAASLGVSRALGYVQNGETLGLRRGRADRQVRLRLTRQAWEMLRRRDMSIEGLEECKELFGA